jgi:hypothetical protein
MIIKLCTLDGIRRKADKSVSLNIGTATEQSTLEMSELDSIFQQHILVAIKEEDTPFNDVELADLSNVNIDLYDTSKSQSKRIRNVLWRLQEQELKRPPTKDEFSVFYNLKTEAIIEHYKKHLDVN